MAGTGTKQFDIKVKKLKITKVLNGARTVPRLEKWQFVCLWQASCEKPSYETAKNMWLSGHKNPKVL